MLAHTESKPETFWAASWIREGPAQELDKLYDPDDRDEAEKFYVTVNEYKVSDLEEYSNTFKAATEASHWDAHSKAKEKLKSSPFRHMFEAPDFALEKVLSSNTYFCRRRNQERIFAVGPTKVWALHALGNGVSTYWCAALKHLEDKPKAFIDGLGADLRASLAEKLAMNKALEASRSSLAQHEDVPDIDMY